MEMTEEVVGEKGSLSMVLSDEVCWVATFE